MEKDYRKTLTMSFYAEPDIKEKVAEEAEKQDRSKSWIINDAIKKYFDCKCKGKK